MLFDDAAIEDGFEAISRIAYLLEHAMCSSGARSAAAAIHTGKSRLSSNDILLKRGSRLPSVHTQGLPAGGRNDGYRYAEGSVEQNSFAPSASGSEANECEFDLHQPLRLPKHCGPEMVALLASIGRTLNTIRVQLQTQVDEKLVAFYEYMKSKEQNELKEIASNRLLVPDGFHLHGDDSTEADLYATLGGNLSRSVRSKEDTSYIHRAMTSSGRRRRSLRSSVRDRSFSGTVNETEIGIDLLLPSVNENMFSGTQTMLWAATSTTDGGRSIARSSRGAPRNAPLARKICERRTVANTLQSFLYIIMESAMTHAEATCAAVYINDMNGGKAITAMNATASGSVPGASAFVSARSTARTADSSQQAASTANAGASAAGDPPRFLHCVAKLNGDDKFPQELSYATMNTLISVVQTGVAVNLRCSDAAESLSATDGTNTAMEDIMNRQSAARKHLNIVNGVIIPIKSFGCIVVGDKKSMVAARDGFTLFDEHVVWSAALMCESILTRYKRELLLEFPWSPSGVPLLRRYMLVNRAARDASIASVSARSRRLRNAKENSGGGSDEGEEKLNLNDQVYGILSLMAGRNARGGDDGGAMAKVLTIVRTADQRTQKVVPKEMLPYAGRKDQGAKDKKGSLKEEELFQGAAQYISNLESLWRQSLVENNTMQTVMSHYDRENEMKEEQIANLETRVRRLNARVVQLERHAASSPQAPPPRVGSAHH